MEGLGSALRMPSECEWLLVESGNLSERLKSDRSEAVSLVLFHKMGLTLASSCLLLSEAPGQ